MPQIILPRSGDPGGAAEAQIRLQSAIDAEFTVLMIIYGEGPDIERVIEVCDGRALAKPAIRRVVWCPDPTVLSADQKKNYFRKDKVAVSVGLSNILAEALPLEKAKARIFVEGAFLEAEGQAC